MLKHKKIISAILAVAMLGAMSTSVFASVQGFYSYLDMSANSLNTGKTRSYDKSKHNIEIDMTDKGAGTNRVDIKEYYENFFTTTLKSTKTASLNTIGSRYKYYMGAFGAGDFFYQFDGRVSTTGGPSTWYKADTVFMYTAD